MIARERIGGVLLLFLGVGALAVAWNYPFEAAFFPRLVAGVIVGCAVTIIARSFWRGYQAILLEESEVGVGWKDPALAAFILMILYVAGVRYVGYLTSTAIFIPLVALAFGYRDWRWIVPVTVGFVGLTGFLFLRVFHTPLPPERILSWF